MAQRTKNFSDREFECSCCGQLNISATWIKFIEKLQEARDQAQVPFTINSGARCAKHNQAVGGKRDSSHLITEFNLAADIKTQNSHVRHRILRSVYAVGFDRVGIGQNFIHVDMDYSKAQGVTWVYKVRTIIRWIKHPVQLAKAKINQRRTAK